MITVGLTYDVKDDWIKSSNEPVDANAEFDRPQTIDLIQSALEANGYAVKRIGNVRKLLQQIDDLGVDIVFNICEGIKGRNRESEVPVLLEMKGIPFVGADGLTLGMTLDKYFTKKMFVADGIPTPRFFTAKSIDDLDTLNTIGFPLIVKTRFEGTSKGLDENSRVEDLDGLKRQVQKINETYNQPALVEEFIRGTEFTVPVIGNGKPKAMSVIQVSIDGTTDLKDEFYTFERVEGEGVRYVCPAKVDKKLEKQMMELAERVFQSVECRDIGRVDFRVDENGNPFVLEINPLPSLDERDVFNIYPQTQGSTYEEMIGSVMEFALKRYSIEKPQLSGAKA